MNIAIFTNNYLPNPYGVAVSIETFRREFEARGHTVYIFAPRWPGYKDTNPNVFRYPSIDIELKIRFPLAIPYSFKMNKLLSRLNLDIIHSQQPVLLGTAAMKWARKKKIPLIFTWHTLYDYYTSFIPFVPKKISTRYIIRKAVKYANQADAVVVPTESIIPILRKWGVTNENITPVATGVEEKEFENPDHQAVRQKYNISDKEIVLVLVTRLSAEKNIEFLFQAVKGVLKRNKNVKFILAGGGYLAPKIKKLAFKEEIEDKIILPGVLERKDIKDYLAAGDIMVDASLSETQGMHVSEAMYMGLPIVAVNAPGISSLVSNNKNGFLVREDENEFAAAVEKLIEDKELRKKFGQASRKIAEENFTSGVCAEKMLEVYERCLKNQS